MNTPIVRTVQTGRLCYRMEKTGEKTQFGFLDEHEVMFWIRKGYTVTRNGENLH